MIPGFTVMSYACVVEPLRAANTLSGKELYRVEYGTIDGEKAVSSSGTIIRPTFRVGEAIDLDVVFVLAGGNPADFHSKKLDSWLRRQARKSVTVGGISGGTYMLARAGLLKGHRCTIHWDHLPRFREDFADLDVRATLFEMDRDRWTCAGGISSLDLMFAMIERDHGPSMAVAAGDWLLQIEVRQGTSPQRASIEHRYQCRHPKLLRALELIEQHIADPIGRQEIAMIVELSVRQLEHLFRTNLGVTIHEHYLSLRLERARLLLRRGTSSVSDVAVSTGFANSSHFSRVYRKRYGRPPTDERRALCE
ncbi:GlxA family transcriptional regulator [Burkholderia sp. MR1-5-21]